MPSSSDGYYRDKSERSSKNNPYQPYIPRPPKKSTASLLSEKSENMSSYSVSGTNGRCDDDLTSSKRRTYDSNTSESSHYTSSTSCASSSSGNETLPPISSLPKIGRVFKEPNAKNESDQDRLNNLRLENTKYEADLQRLRELCASLDDKIIKIKSKVHGNSLLTSKEYTENLKLLTDSKRRLADVEKRKSDNQYSIDRIQASLNGDTSVSSSTSSQKPRKPTPLTIDSVRFVINEMASYDQPEAEDPPLFEFFDSNDHWCTQCDSISPTIEEYLAHLHTEEHINRTPEDRDRPWPIKRRPQFSPDPDRPMHPMLGSQFLVPCKAFYCSICKMFLGDNEVATEHLLSVRHNKLVQTFESSRPEYKKVFEQDRSAALARRDAEERRKKRIAEEKAIEEQKKLEAAMMEEQAKRSKEAAEKARKEELQRKAEQEAERLKRMEMEKQTLFNAKALKKPRPPSTQKVRDAVSLISKSTSLIEPKDSHKRKRSKSDLTSVDSTVSSSSSKSKGKKKFKPEETVALQDCYVLISIEDQTVALSYVEDAKYFQCGNHVHKFNEEEKTWSQETVDNEGHDDTLLGALDDQTATDDEAYVTNPDPMLASSLHDQILNALDTVVKSSGNTYAARAGDSSGVTENGSSSLYSRETSTAEEANDERPSTPNKQSIGSTVFDSSPCSIITGTDVILSKQCSIDGTSLLSGACSEEPNDPTDDCDNLNIEIPQLNLDVLANDE